MGWSNNNWEPINQVHDRCCFRTGLKYNLFQGESEILFFPGEESIWVVLAFDNSPLCTTDTDFHMVWSVTNVWSVRSSQNLTPPWKIEISASPWNMLYLMRIRRDAHFCTWSIGSFKGRDHAWTCADVIILILKTEASIVPQSSLIWIVTKSHCGKLKSSSLKMKIVTSSLNCVTIQFCAKRVTFLHLI